jgi:xylulokinase
MFFLSVDFGTSAVKAAVTNESGTLLDWAAEEYSYITLPGEKAELAPDVLLRALESAVSRLDSALRKQVELFCYDTFSPSPVFMDREGDLVYPNIITHLDRRSRGQSAYIDETLGREKYRALTGIYPFAGGCSAMTVIWFKQNMPEVLDRTCYFGHLPAYIHKKLTGRWAFDFVNASMTGLYETTRQGGWSRELLSAFGLREAWFGEILDPGAEGGSLLPQAASRLGLPAGLPVRVGTNDMAAAIAGAGNTRAGDILISAGSSEMVSILTDKPVTGEDYYLRNAALPGLWQIYATTAGGFAVDWFYRELCRGMEKKDFFAYFDACLEKRDEYLAAEVRFAPYLAGDRQSLEKKTASWTGLTLAATREHLLLALVEGIQGVIQNTIQRAEAILPTRPLIKITGGMVTEPYIRYKRRAMPRYDIEQVDDCPIKGNVVLALRQGE